MADRICVFISYKRENQDTAEQLWEKLADWGYDRWLDVKNIQSGISPQSSTWIGSIDRGLKQSQVLVGIITPESLASENVLNEWFWARQASRRILLLRLEPFDIEDMPHVFAATDYIDLVDNPEKGYQRLKRELASLGDEREAFKVTIRPTKTDTSASEILPVPDYLQEVIKPKSRYVPWRLTLRVLAMLGLIVSFIWLIVLPDFEPLISFLGALAALIGSFVGESSTDGDLKDRGKLSDVEQMRKRVYQYWVKGVMQTALAEVERTGIGMNMQPEATLRDGGRNIGDIDLPNDSRNVRQVYDTFNQFLILGEPGAGKTIMLLQLAENLILNPPPTHKNAIPLVLNLSSWSLSKKPLHQWIEEETWRSYRVRGNRVGKWLENNQLILLLDGLDEVKEEVRVACVDAINTFRQKYDYVPMVVCSRIRDYERLGESKLQLQGAILLEQLTQEQVNSYLADANLQHIRNVVNDDPIMGEMAKIPFLLNTMIYTYRHLPETAIRGYDTDAKRREHLFNNYVQRRLQDNPSPWGYQQTVGYLKWLATKMQAYVQTVFHPDDIDGRWLADDSINKSGLRLFLNLHIVARFRIYQRDLAPFRLGNFLHALVDRQILREMGGGYIFIHRYLLENFAGLDEIFVLLTQLQTKNRRDIAIETLEKLMIESPETTARAIQSAIAWDKENVHPTERAYGLQILHDAGIADARLYIGVKAGLPDIDWVHIPDDGEWIYQNEKRAGLGDYDISRYPVTYAQFQCFVDAPDGLYSEDHDWFEGLAADESDKQLHEQAFKYSNHPRENVNWYQAMAFCRWLSWKLAPDTFEMMKIETWAVRLPTEFEWEKAARGIDGRKYPYGDEFDASKGNTSETGIGMTSAVGIFPDGASPYGVLDMSGNVWELCLSEDDNPAEHPRDENISSASDCLMRGGSWSWSLIDTAHATYRGSAYVNFRFSYIGFRVVRPPSL